MEIQSPESEKNPADFQEPQNGAENDAVPDMHWLAEEMHKTAGFSQVYSETAEKLGGLRNMRTALKRNRDKTPEETQTLTGLNKVWNDGMNAVRELATNAALERRSLNRSEQNEIRQQIGKLTLAVYLEKLDENARTGVLQKIAADPKAYDRYVKRITGSSQFEEMLQNPAPLKPNELCKKGMVARLEKRIDDMMTENFSKAVHIHNTRLENHAPEEHNPRVRQRV